jgi:ElaB/YqjD/DUF883 family membrane-anchored ribosome-binding protein
MAKVMRTVDEFNLAKTRMTGDLKTVIADSEDLLKAAVNVSGEGFAVAREKFEEKIRNAKTRLAEASQPAIEKARDTAAATDDYVHAHPWAAIGVFTAVGVLIGILTARR